MQKSFLSQKYNNLDPSQRLQSIYKPASLQNPPQEVQSCKHKSTEHIFFELSASCWPRQVMGMILFYNQELWFAS